MYRFFFLFALITFVLAAAPQASSSGCNRSTNKSRVECPPNWEGVLDGDDAFSCLSMSECETPLVPEHPDAHAGSTSSFSSRLGDDDEGSHGAHGSSPNNQRKGSQSSTSSSCPQHQITIRIAQNPYGSSPSTDSCSCSCNRK